MTGFISRYNLIIEDDKTVINFKLSSFTGFSAILFIVVAEFCCYCFVIVVNNDKIPCNYDRNHDDNDEVRLKPYIEMSPSICV